MNELWIKFRDENGEERRILIGKEQFIIGRHSASDLAIADSRLSRQHAKIERFDDKYFISDLGSSNGTELNGQPLSEKTPVKNGDTANLGRGLMIEFQLGDENEISEAETDFEAEAAVEEPANAFDQPAFGNPVAAP